MANPAAIRTLTVGLVLTVSCRHDDDAPSINDSGESTATFETTESSTTNDLYEASSSSTTYSTAQEDSEAESAGPTDPNYACGDGVSVAEEVCFHPLLNLVAQRPTAALGVGDFDGDEQLDLVAGHADGLTIHFGRNDGSFETVIEGDSQRVVALAVVNFDQDGRDEIVTAHSDDDQNFEISSYVVDTNRNVTTLEPLSVGSAPVAIATGFVDNDEHIDLVIAREATNTVQILNGDGAGHWTPGTELLSGTAPASLAMSNIDGRLGLDVLVANSGATSISVFLRTETSFSVEIGLATHVGPRALASADFNLDGHPDLVVAHETAGTVGLWHGTGTTDPLFATPPSIVGLGGRPRALATGYFDGDEYLDVAVLTNANGRVSILRSTDPGFAYTDFWSVLSQPVALVTADFNHDEVTDLAIASDALYGGVGLLLSNP